MSDPIHYSILPADAGAHLFEVTVRVPEPDANGQLFRMPAWIPGSYLIRDFARNVVSVRASCEGVALDVGRVDKSSWLVEACSGPLELVLEVYALELNVRGAHFDHRHAYFNGPVVFPAAVGLEDRPCELDIQPPAGGVGSAWRVATAMRPQTAERFGYGTYQAENYWELIDHPVEIGEFVAGEFDVAGIPHSIVVRGHDRFDMARLCRDLTEVCEQHHKLLGAPKTLDRYVFLLTALEQGYGGLEHRWSSSNICSREDLPKHGATKVSAGYRKLLGLCSHEYFHLWNVTRMKPASFTPYDLAGEAYTGLLWVFEGITSYYDDLALARCGAITPESYLELVAQVITRMLRAPGRHRQSVEESSFDAWTKFYKQDAGSPNFIVSYYAKGSLVALALDLTIRQKTNDRYSLDDVMRECWTRYGETGVGMPERGLESVAESVCNIDLSNFFERTVRGTGDVELEELLLGCGVRVHRRAATDSKDKGGQPAGNGDDGRPWLGATLNVADGKSVFGPVSAGSPAEHAGVSPGDEAVALDERRLSASNLDARLAEYAPGDTVSLSVFRREDLVRMSVTLAEPAVDTCYLTLDESVDDDVARRRDSWLSS